MQLQVRTSRSTTLLRKCVCLLVDYRKCYTNGNKISLKERYAENNISSAILDSPLKMIAVIGFSTLNKKAQVKT